MNMKCFINCKVHTNEALSLIVDEHAHAHTSIPIGIHSFIKILLLQRELA